MLFAQASAPIRAALIIQFGGATILLLVLGLLLLGDALFSPALARTEIGQERKAKRGRRESLLRTRQISA